MCYSSRELYVYCSTPRVFFLEANWSVILSMSSVFFQRHRASVKERDLKPRTSNALQKNNGQEYSTTWLSIMFQLMRVNRSVKRYSGLPVHVPRHGFPQVKRILRPAVVPKHSSVHRVAELHVQERT